MIEIACLLVSIFLLLAAMIRQPTHAACPHGWDLRTGVRRDGSYACWPKPRGDSHRNARGVLVDDSVQPPGEIRGRVYCTGGAQPIVFDGEAVGCQQRGGSI